ncbi:MAG: aldehyde dehydrogenase family protein, partial [Vicinamibacteria bacterium]
MAHAYGQLVDGKWETGTEAISVIDKYSGEEIGTVPSASKDDVTRAVGAAAKAFPAYADLPAHRRAKVLARASELLAKYQEDLATIICREAGKAWKFSMLEVARAIETFQFAAEEAKRVHGETIPMDASAGGENRMGFYIRTPVG